MAGLLGNVAQVYGTHTGGEKRLVSITPSGIHYEHRLVGTNGLGESLGTLFEQDLAPTLGARLAHVDLVAGLIKEIGNHNVALELGLTDLSLDAASVDSNVTQVCQELRSAVLAVDHVEQLWGLVDERSPNLVLHEYGMSEQRRQEGDVGFYSTNAEFDQGTKHLAAGNLKRGAMASTLDQPRTMLARCPRKGKRRVANTWSHSMLRKG